MSKFPCFSHYKKLENKLNASHVKLGRINLVNCWQKTGMWLFHRQQLIQITVAIREFMIYLDVSHISYMVFIYI